MAPTEYDQFPQGFKEMSAPSLSSRSLESAVRRGRQSAYGQEIEGRSAVTEGSTEAMGAL